MAVDCYLAFKPYEKDWLTGESTADLTKMDPSAKALMSQPSAFPTDAGKFFEIEDYSFDIQQTLNIGSQSTGAGAGKITFNPFSITRKIDKASPTFFTMACNGTTFESVILIGRKSGGGDSAGVPFLRFDFKLVAVKTISWSHGDESPNEHISFEYGGLQMRYAPQKSNGTVDTPIAAGWNRVRNAADTDGKKI